jgi:hypothetical protein
MDEAQARAFHNVRNFLRGVLIGVLSTDELQGKGELQVMLMGAVNALVPY